MMEVAIINNDVRRERLEGDYKLEKASGMNEKSRQGKCTCVERRKEIF